MRVFVTGATGVIGTRAVPLLVRDGHQVTAIGRSVEKRARIEAAGGTAIAASLFDSPGLARAMNGHDAVLNLATSIPSSSLKMMLPGSWKENDRIRRDGSAAVVSAALDAGVPRVVQESFAPMYADGGDGWLDETAPVQPASYNRSTLDAEHSVERFVGSGGTGVTLRFAAFYGPDRLLRDMLDVIRKGWSPLPGDPRAYVTSLAQDDAASAVVAALTVPSGTYNVAENEPMRRGEWVASLAHAAGYKAPRPLPRWLTRMIGGPMELLSRSLRISNRKFREASGWEPRYPRADQAWNVVLAELRHAA
ncbi:MAG TPA: NAD(P)-dependent oxidoreductase [Gemmatimonadaceae bacterium]